MCHIHCAYMGRKTACAQSQYGRTNYETFFAKSHLARKSTIFAADAKSRKVRYLVGQFFVLLASSREDS